MILTWKHGTKKDTISEELLDEKIEVSFSQAQQYFETGNKTSDWDRLEKSYMEFQGLVSNSRLLSLSTDRHKVVLFESYYHIAEILYLKKLPTESLKNYLKAVQIRDTHMDCWFKMGEIFMMQESTDFPQGKDKGKLLINNIILALK